MMKHLLIIPLISLCLFAVQPVNATTQSNYTGNYMNLSDGELAQILAPIALYPDTLLSHILIASTYPIEVVEAYRWLEKNGELNTEQLFSLAENKNWDASVIALLPFPTVLKRLNDDLSWSRNIGDAFLADESQVLAVIQQLRQQADQAGNLSQMDNMEVNYDNNNIVIQPVKREVVYVPYYDSRTVYGNWYWYNYPPVYWSNVRINHGYYSPFYWQPGIHISFNYFFGAFHWNQRQLVVVNHRNSHRYNHRQRIISSHGSQRWQHKPQHRRGVAYSNNLVKKRYNSHKISMSQRKHERLASHKTEHKASYKKSRHQKLVTKQKQYYSKKHAAKHRSINGVDNTKKTKRTVQNVSANQHYKANKPAKSSIDNKMNRHAKQSNNNKRSNTKKIQTTQNRKDTKSRTSTKKSMSANQTQRRSTLNKTSTGHKKSYANHRTNKQSKNYARQKER